MKRVARALHPALLALIGQQPPGVEPFVRAALWHTTDSWAVDGPPRWLWAAVQWRLAQAGAKAAAVGVLLSGGAWRVGTMAADRGFQEDAAVIVERFLRAVSDGVPPEPVGAIDLDVAKRLWPVGGGESAALPSWSVTAWERTKALRKALGLARRERSVLEARLRAALRDAPYGVMPDGRRLALRQLSRGRRLVEVR